MRKQPRRRATPVPDDRVSVADTDDVQSVENDENTPIHDENAFSQPDYAPVHRSSSVLAFRTPISHSRTDQDTALRDITDQFFHPPSPSPVRISKPKRSAPFSIEPPRRPKKPKSLAYPADPPNWLYSRPSSSLPPSSPLPPSTTNFDHARLTDHSAGYDYPIDTPSKASDPDPFGFVAVERAVKAKRAPTKPTKRISAVKSPPRSTVIASAPSHVSTFASFSQLGAPIPTNYEDIEGLYSDEPVAGPSHTHVPVAPLLMMNSDQPLAEKDATRSQPSFPDPLRTPRKRRRHPSPTPGRDLDSDEGASPPSSPSPVKVSVGVTSHRRPGIARSSDTSALKVAGTQSRAANTNKSPPVQPRTKRIKRSYQDIPTPSSTPISVRRSSRQSSAPPTPVLPRRSTRKAVVGARAETKRTTSNEEERHDRMKLRSRNTKATVTTEKRTTRSSAKVPPATSKTRTRSQKATTTPAKPARGRPKGKQRTKDVKGKGKGRPLESVLDLSDDTREKYEKERRERLEYFKRLEGYQIQKENVYVV